MLNPGRCQLFYSAYQSLFPGAASAAEADPLPSWNDGPAKKAILDFVKTTTDKSNPNFVPPEERIATFDQDGTTWVSHPIYSQVLFAFDRVAALAPQHPEWKTKQPFQAVLTGDKDAMAKFTLKDIEALVLATHTGMTTDAFQAIVKDWMANGEASAFPQTLFADGVPADAGGHALSARQRLQDLHCDRRRAGFRPRICAAGLRHPSGTDYRLGAHDQVRIRRWNRAS